MLRLLASIGLVFGLAFSLSGVSVASETPRQPQVATAPAVANQPQPNCEGEGRRPQVPGYSVGVTIGRQPAVSPSGDSGVAVTVQLCPSYGNTVQSAYLIVKTFKGNSVTPADLLNQERRPVPVAVPPEGIVMSFNSAAPGASAGVTPGVSVVMFDGTTDQPIGANFAGG